MSVEEGDPTPLEHLDEPRLGLEFWPTFDLDVHHTLLDWQTADQPHQQYPDPQQHPQQYAQSLEQPAVAALGEASGSALANGASLEHQFHQQQLLSAHLQALHPMHIHQLGDPVRSLA
jgi:hypothetical protein